MKLIKNDQNWSINDQNDQDVISKFRILIYFSAKVTIIMTFNDWEEGSGAVYYFIQSDEDNEKEPKSPLLTS